MLNFNELSELKSADTVAAKGGGGGKPGGGGGDPNILTTYTSGVADNAGIDYYNITINFSGSWTVKQQKIVTWAADLGLVDKGEPQLC